MSTNGTGIAMTRVRRRILSLGVAAGALVLTTASIPQGVAAQDIDGDVDVVNAETVQAYADASGKITEKRLYEQLQFTGTGEVNVHNPTLTDGLRNLNGFGGYDVEDGDQVVNLNVDGEEDFRSVSNFDGDLPVSVDVTYFLDGEEVQPGDLVGGDGQVEVRYKVTNETARTQEVTYEDANGETVTKETEVTLPLVGSLETNLPASFSDVKSEAANLAGNGRGGHLLSFTMTLMPPLGSSVVEVGYTAKLIDGVVPGASLTVLPINPYDNPTFQKLGGSLENGAAKGRELAAGAQQIDDNLLKLRDGAAELVAGLIQLDDGAKELSSGLVNQAAPGARELSAGAGQLEDGLDEASSGGQDLKQGLNRLSGGLDDLAGALPAAKGGIKELRAGVRQLLAGVGGPGNAESLIGGLTALNGGHAQLIGGAQQISAGLPAAVAGVEGLIASLQAKTAPAGSTGSLFTAAQVLEAAVVGSAGCQSDPMCKFAGQGLVTQLREGAQGTEDSIPKVQGLLDRLKAAQVGLDDSILPGLRKVQAGSQKLLAGAKQLKGGLNQVDGGLSQLSEGIAAAVGGALQLQDGGRDAAAGGATLAGGLNELEAGSDQLSSGASELSSGIGDAADGSERLSAGLGDARQAAPQLPEGAEELSERGSQELLQAGKGTVQEFGTQVAVLQAGAARADEEKMIVGAPEDAIGLAAYSVEIQGEDGAGARNAKRVLGTILLLAAGGALLLGRRFLKS